MNEKVRSDLDKMCEIISNTTDVERIYLFGSYAYGTPNPDSDYDLCVVVPDGDMRPMDIALNIRKALYSIQTVPIDLLVYHSSRFNERKKMATIERLISREGIVLYEKKAK